MKMKTARKFFKITSTAFLAIALFVSSIIYFGGGVNLLEISTLSIVTTFISHLAILFSISANQVDAYYDRNEIKLEIIDVKKTHADKKYKIHELRELRDKYENEISAYQEKLNNIDKGKKRLKRRLKKLE